MPRIDNSALAMCGVSKCTKPAPAPRSEAGSGEDTRDDSPFMGLTTGVEPLARPVLPADDPVLIEILNEFGHLSSEQKENQRKGRELNKQLKNANRRLTLKFVELGLKVVPFRRGRVKIVSRVQIDTI